MYANHIRVTAHNLLNRSVSICARLWSKEPRQDLKTVEPRGSVDSSRAPQVRDNVIALRWRPRRGERTARVIPPSPPKSETLPSGSFFVGGQGRGNTTPSPSDDGTQRMSRSPAACFFRRKYRSEAVLKGRYSASAGPRQLSLEKTGTHDFPQY